MSSGVPAMPKYKLFSVEADGAVVTGEGRLMYVILVGHNNATDLQLHDAAGATNEIMEIHCPAGDSRVFNFQEVGGIPFWTGLYADISGVGAHAWVWVD